MFGFISRQVTQGRFRRIGTEVPELRVYKEGAFHYFLALERKRAERSGRLYLLFLVDLKASSGPDECIDPATASMLFSNLRLCLRDTDFTGWYRADRVAGAVLTELRRESLGQISSLVDQRVGAVLLRRLPSHMADRLRLRVHEQPEFETNDSDGAEYCEQSHLRRRT